MEVQATLINQRKVFLSSIIGIAEEQIKLTTDRITEYDNNSQKIMQGMIGDLEGMLFGLGLEDDQEKALVQLVDQASLKLQDNKSKTADLSTDLGVILESLYEFMVSNY